MQDAQPTLAMLDMVIFWLLGLALAFGVSLVLFCCVKTSHISADGSAE